MNRTKIAARRRLPGDREDATTSELRYDWLADRWVIIAPQRTQRPVDFNSQTVIIQDGSNCPFCLGREAETPQAVASYYPTRDDGKPSPWRVRVVPNKFPAVNTPDGSVKFSDAQTEELSDDEKLELDASQPERIDLFRRRELFGGHEVIVESPRHITSVTELDRESIALVFRAYRERLDYWINERGVAYAVLFKNVGEDAGASLAHSHSQLIATNILPTDISRCADRMKLFFDKECSCLFCRMSDDEIEQGQRVVEETVDFVAFCPFASRIPSLVTVIPKFHQASFDQLTSSQTEELSQLSHRLIRRIEKCHPDSAYNFVIHTAPRCLTNSAYFHWRMELFPRLTKIAGFEWGSDCYINPITPEDAASRLRKAGV